MTCPNEWLKLNNNTNKTFQLIIWNYATCHYHIFRQISHMGHWKSHDVKRYEQICVFSHGQMGENIGWVNHFSSKKMMYNKYNKCVVNWNFDDIFWKP